MVLAPVKTLARSAFTRIWPHRWLPLALLAKRYPKEPLRQFRRRIRSLVPFGLPAVQGGMIIGGLLLVALADRWVFGKSLGPISYGRTLSGKAGSSVLDIVGYAASHGGYALWAARATKTQSGEGVGAMLYIM